MPIAVPSTARVAFPTLVTAVGTAYVLALVKFQYQPIVLLSLLPWLHNGPAAVPVSERPNILRGHYVPNRVPAYPAVSVDGFVQLVAPSLVTQRHKPIRCLTVPKPPGALALP